MSIRYPAEGERIIITAEASGIALYVETYVSRPIHKSVYGCSVWRLRAYGVGEFHYDAGKDGGNGVATLVNGIMVDEEKLVSDPWILRPEERPNHWKPYSLSHRCCNIHMNILEPQGHNLKDRGGQLLKCPYCSVGVWSNAKTSLPASSELRALRSEVFTIAKQRAHAGYSTLPNGQSITQPYGKLNRAEAVALLEPPRPVPVAAAMQRFGEANNISSRLIDAAEKIMRDVGNGVKAATTIRVRVEPKKIREIDLD